MNSKKRTILIIALIAALVVAAGAGTMAFLTARANNGNDLTNTFTLATLTGRIDEPGFSDGSAVKENIQIANTGSAAAFIRVRLVGYWVAREDASVVYPDSVGVSVAFDGEEWTQFGDMYYYNGVVAPGDSTGNLLTGGISAPAGAPAEVTMDGVTYHFTYAVDVMAQGIQCNPVRAAESAWGRSITVNGAAVTWG